MVLRSAWIPAPPEASLPATQLAFGLRGQRLGERRTCDGQDMGRTGHLYQALQDFHGTFAHVCLSLCYVGKATALLESIFVLPEDRSPVRMFGRPKK